MHACMHVCVYLCMGLDMDIIDIQTNEEGNQSSGAPAFLFFVYADNLQTYSFLLFSIIEPHSYRLKIYH